MTNPWIYQQTLWRRAVVCKDCQRHVEQSAWDGFCVYCASPHGRHVLRRLAKKQVTVKVLSFFNHVHESFDWEFRDCPRSTCTLIGGAVIYPEIDTTVWCQRWKLRVRTYECPSCSRSFETNRPFLTKGYAGLETWAHGCGAQRMMAVLTPATDSELVAWAAALFEPETTG